MPFSPLAEAIARRIELQFPGEVARGLVDTGKRFRVVSYLNEFSRLWQLNHELTDELLERTRTLILVWDGIPAEATWGEINVQDHLTAADWGIALSLVVEGRAKKLGRSESWRLIVVDSASGKYPSSRTLRLFLTLQGTATPLLPWIKIYPDREIEKMVAGIEDEGSHPPATDLEMLRQTWSALLADPGRASDRHAIANLVGPRLLLAAFGKDSDVPSTCSDALTSLLRALQMVPAKAPCGTGAWVSSRHWQDLVEGFVLVDDMHEYGWARFLELALGLERGDKKLEVLSGIQPSRAFGENQILFLDLRLFSGKPWSEECAYLETLLGIAKGFPAENTHLPWPGFSSAELAAIGRFLQSPLTNSSDYSLALTMLPRILALRFPTLPIILFSSTGRREITAILQKYGTVFADFEKPRFFGDKPSDLVWDSRTKFVRAMNRALGVARGRKTCNQLRTRHAHALPKVSGKIVEIYIDESQGANNRGPFAVGGVILAYPDEKAVALLDGELKRSALIWGLADGYPPTRATEPIPVSYLPKQPSEQEAVAHATKLNSIFESLGVSVHAFALLEDISANDRRVTAKSFLDDHAMDNRFRNMLTEVLEGVLFDVIGFGKGIQEIRIDVATRTPPARDNRQLELLRSQLGIFVLRTENKYFSLTSCEVWPIVAKLLGFRRMGSGKSGIVTRARAVTLLDYRGLEKRSREYLDLYEDQITQRTRPRPKQIHFLADWAVRFATLAPDKIPEIVANWFSRGFIERRAGSFASWTSASRAAAAQDYVSAVLNCDIGARMEKCSHGHVPWNFSRFLVNDCPVWIDRLKGQDFIKFCKRLPR